MKKSLVAGAIALALGTAGTANALTVNVTNMFFNGNFGATGEIDSTGSGSFTSTGTFFGQPWTADALAYFSGAGAYNWSVTGANAANDSIPIGPASYNFNLTANQVAWGTFFDWNNNNDIPVLAIMTCTGFTAGSTCAGTGTPMATPPFQGAAPAFSGVVTSASTTVIPVPAAAWLLGSGLLGLVGVARRRSKQS